MILAESLVITDEYREFSTTTKGHPIPKEASTGEEDADNKKESEMSTNDHRVCNVTRNGIVCMATHRG
jgi:hypothetical protein